MDWVEELGGGAVGTLAAAFGLLSRAVQSQPLLPLQPPGLERVLPRRDRGPRGSGSAAQARDLLASAEFQAEAGRLRESRLVDYRRGMALKRRVLEELAEAFFRKDPAAT